MSKKDKLFRKEALEKLSSPEQLDRLMNVTNSRAWLALGALGILIFTIILWSIFGRISTRVSGDGMLIKRGGVLDIVSTGSGQITALYTTVGDDVQKGEIIARIAQPELTQKIAKAKVRLEEMRGQHQRVISLSTTDTKLREEYIGKQRANIQGSIRANADRLRWLRSHRRKQAQLAAQGLVTKQSVQATKSEIDAVRDSIRSARGQLNSFSVSTQELSGQKEKEVLSSQLRINEMDREIELLEERLELTGRVVSPHSGRVLEVRVSEGDIARPGMPFLTLEPSGTEGLGLEALIYVPLASGKRLRPGMRVQISPASVKQEEHGVMHGIVTSVAEFPSSQAGMKQLLENDLLVQNLLSSVGLAPIAVQAELIPNAHTISGYKWTSKEGPPVQLGPGTPCRAQITVKKTRPIGKVIPAIQSAVGVN